MRPPGHPDRPPFFSAPLDDEEVQRLAAIVDERLRQRPARDLPDVHVPLDSAPLPQLPHPDHALSTGAESIQRLPAPLFDASKGGRVTRFAKRLLNVPLRVAAAPQLYFNAALRSILLGWSQFAQSSADFQEILRIELAGQRRRLDRLAREQQRLAALVEELRDALRRSAPRHAVVDGYALELTCGPRGRRITVTRNERKASLVAAVDALPFAAGTVGELLAVGRLEELARGDVERRLLPHWRQLLQPGGRLRLRCTDWREPLDGSPGTASPKSDAVLSLLARAGFVDCSVRGTRDDGTGAPTRELVAHRPSSQPAP